jgi:hemolysin III
MAHDLHPTSGYPPTIELLNSLTHALGIILALAGLVLTVVWASLYAGPVLIIACAVYGASLVLLYTASTLYHAVRDLTWKRIFLVCDHAGIYLLIAGTYTPITLGPLAGPLGWTICGLVWALALAGLGKEILLPGRGGLAGSLIYLAMGWICVIAIVPLWRNLSPFSFACLIAGGLVYSGGITFYLWRRFAWHHIVWHLFVLGGSVCHFFAIFSYLAGLADGGS